MRIVVDVKASVGTYFIITVGIVQESNVGFFQTLPVISLVAIAWRHDEIIHCTTTLDWNRHMRRTEGRVPWARAFKVTRAFDNVLAAFLHDIFRGRNFFVQFFGLRRTAKEQDEDNHDDNVPNDDEIYRLSEADCIIQCTWHRWPYEGAESEDWSPQTRHETWLRRKKEYKLEIYKKMNENLKKMKRKLLKI